ncbi:MAG TPA: hypothetical protein VL727_20135 [Puia sp.]|jgi:hypothetical protein|nr:hypothetical protein [Puia sp.]
MAEDPLNDVTWLLEIEQQHLDYLGPIRHWEQLKIAASPGSYWISGLTADRVDLPEIKGIPFKHLYFEKGQLLFHRGGLVPVKQLPGSLVWTPLEKGLPLDPPSFNHNYFGITEKLAMRLVPSGKVEDPAALLTSIAILRSYILTAPAVRLKPLLWVMLDDQALIMGRPLLPLPGDSFWQRDEVLLPAGLDWEWPVLEPALSRELNPARDHCLLWDQDGQCTRIEKTRWRRLSISSFRLSTTKRF